MFFRHVPEKVLAGMQWAAKELPTNWLYTSIDDDIAVDFTKMVNFFNGVINNKFTLPTGAINFSSIPIVCEYSYQDRDPPNRESDSKWYMPWKDFPGTILASILSRWCLYNYKLYGCKVV